MNNKILKRNKDYIIKLNKAGKKNYINIYRYNIEKSFINNKLKYFIGLNKYNKNVLNILLNKSKDKKLYKLFNRNLLANNQSFSESLYLMITFYKFIKLLKYIKANNIDNDNIEFLFNTIKNIYEKKI